MTGHTLFGKAAMRRFRFAVPADKTSGNEYLYIVAFDTGLTKVGYTVNPQSRITAHVTAAAIHGASPAAGWVSTDHTNARTNETLLIDFCTKRATTRLASEYFLGIDFADVVDESLSLTYHRTKQEVDDATAAMLAQLHADPEAAASIAYTRARLDRTKGWGKPGRDGKTRVISKADYEKFMDLVDEAKETRRLLKDLFGLRSIPHRRLPEALRRAANDIEQAKPTVRFFLLEDWDQLLASEEGGLDTSNDPNPLDALDAFFSSPATPTTP